MQSSCRLNHLRHVALNKMPGACLVQRGRAVICASKAADQARRVEQQGGVIIMGATGLRALICGGVQYRTVETGARNHGSEPC